MNIPISPSALLLSFFTTKAYLINLSISFSSFAKEITSLVADKVSSTIPPNYFVTLSFLIIASLYYLPMIITAVNKIGKKAKQAIAKMGALAKLIITPHNTAARE